MPDINDCGDSPFGINEKVFCQYGQLLYEAKILQVKPDADGSRAYLIHYCGWSKRHDEWTPEAGLHKLSDRYPLRVRSKKRSSITSKRLHLNRHGKSVPDKVMDLEINNFSCEQCDFKTSSKLAFKQHVQCIHEREAGLHMHIDRYLLRMRSKKSSSVLSKKLHLNRQGKSVPDKVMDLEINAFSCEQCDFKTSRKVALKRHVQSIHERKGNVQCEQCGYKPAQKVNLRRHVEAVHGKIKRFSCKYCRRKAFSRKEHLKQHVKVVHRGVKNFKCDKCDYKTGWKKELVNHVNGVHNNLYITCEYCEYKTSRKLVFQLHMKRYHAISEQNSSEGTKRKIEEYRQLCEFNKDLNRDQSPFRTHKKSSRAKHANEAMHGKIKRFKCNHCHYKTGYKSALKLHVKTVHKKVKPSKCNQPHYKTVYKPTLNLHVKTVNNKIGNFHCELCDYQTAQKRNLRRHVEAVHDKIKRFACKYCRIKVSRKEHLEKHVEVVHKGLKNFKCEKCDYKTAWKKELVNHVNGVHNNIYIACEHCDYKTSRKICFQLHMKRHHVITEQNSSEGRKLKNDECSQLSEFNKDFNSDQYPFRTHQKSYLEKHVEVKTLKGHVEYAKELGKQFPCVECDYKAPTRYYLKKHVENDHEKCICGQCDNEGPEAWIVQDDTKVPHKKTQDLKCDICDYTTSKKGCLQIHMRMHHDKHV